MKFPTIAFLVAGVIAVSDCDAQLSFKRVYGPGSAQSVKQTNDSGYIISGVSIVNATEYPFLMKTNQVGEPEWTITFPSHIAALTTVQCINGGYFMTIGDWAKYYDTTIIICTDFLGTVTNTRKLVGNIYSTSMTASGEILATGAYTIGAGVSDLLVSKFDNFGNPIWLNIYDNFWRRESGYCISEAENQNILVGGWCQNPSYNNVLGFMVKLTPTGTIIHKKEIGNSVNNVYYSVLATDSQYFFTGYGSNNFNGIGFLITESDSTFNTLNSVYDFRWAAGEAFDILRTNDNGFALLIEPEGPFPNVKRSGIRKMKSDLSIQWEKLYDEIEDSAYGSFPYEMIQCSDSGFAIAGEGYFYSMNNRFITLTKIDAQGNLACGDTSFVTYPVVPQLTDAVLTTTGVTPQSLIQSSTLASPMIFVDSVICLFNPQAVGIEERFNDHHSIYPIPTTDELHIGDELNTEFEILDVNGKIVMRGKIVGSSINVSILESGMYTLILKDFCSAKFIKQ